jgi:hypothetical protein
VPTLAPTFAPPAATPAPTPVPTATPSTGPVAPPAITADRESTIPGGTVEVCGEGWMPGSEVELSLDGDPVLGTVTADENGEFCVELEIPAGTVEGEYGIVANGTDAAGEPSAQVQGITVALPETDAATPRPASGGHGQLPAILALIAATGAVFALLRRPVHRP